MINFSITYQKYKESFLLNNQLYNYLRAFNTYITKITSSI